MYVGKCHEVVTSLAPTAVVHHLLPHFKILSDTTTFRRNKFEHRKG